MRISRRMSLTVSGLAFAGATVFTLGAAESASAQTATLVPRHSVATSSSLVQWRRHGRYRGRYARWYTPGGGATYYSFSYYKRVTWDWWSCCCC